MLMTIVLVGVAHTLLLVCRGTSPRTRVAPLAAECRAAWVESHPGEVTTSDVERVLLRDGLSTSDVRLVVELAEARRIKPFTMWMWIQSYGARELALAVAGDLPHDELMERLGDGTPPDFERLELFAALNGLEAAAADVSLTESCPTCRRDRRPALVPAEPRRLPEGWDSFFDDLPA